MTDAERMILKNQRIITRGPVKFEPKTPPQIVEQAAFDNNIIIVQRLAGTYEALPRGEEAEIAGPCRVRVRRGRLELVVNHDVPIRWTPAGRARKTAPSNPRRKAARK